MSLITWRILKDWVEAQMALLETGMVTMDESFLPYMVSGGQTFTRPWWPVSSRR